VGTLTDREEEGSNKTGERENKELGPFRRTKNSAGGATTSAQTVKKKLKNYEGYER